MFQEFLDLLDPLFTGLQEENQPDGTGAALSWFTDDFVDLRTRIERTQHRRPHIALAASGSSGIHHVEQVLRHDLAALEAPTPIEAQRHADQAQSHLDQAGGAAVAPNAAEASTRSIPPAAGPCCTRCSRPGWNAPRDTLGDVRER